MAMTISSKIRIDIVDLNSVRTFPGKYAVESKRYWQE